MGPMLLVLAAIQLPVEGGDVPRLVPSVEEDYPADSDEFALLFGAGCSLGCALDWSYSATSSLPAIEDNSYGPENVDDIDPSTAWVEGVEGWGIGESITVEFQEYPGTSYADEDHGVNFNGMTIQNGYAKDEDTWLANGRVHELGLYLDGELIGILELEDVMAAQTIYWDHQLDVRDGDTFEMEILSVYEGERWQDTAISGLMYWGAH